MHKKNIVWLASYPKSGNTWFRVFLTNLLYGSEKPADINDLAEASISSSRKIFDDYTGLSSSDLSFQEIDKLRPDVYRLQSEETTDLLFKKVHDQFSFVSANQPMFPPEVSLGVIYLIRNPMDVLVSFAYHNARSVEKMIAVLNNSNYALCNQNDKLQNQLRQLIGTWSDHVKSWTEQTIIPVHVIRYEDMILNTFNSFSAALSFLKINKTENQIKEAIEKSDFKVLSEQEMKDGFKEKTLKSTVFFRKGVVGDWKNYLTKEMQNEIIRNHYEMMRRFGYLDENDNFTF